MCSRTASRCALCNSCVALPEELAQLQVALAVEEAAGGYVTSEVLILNKRAVVVAADSAITSSGGEHPRYSKSATKIFDLSVKGSVAGAFFGNALVDGVPWEVAIKLFRRHLGGTTFDRVSEYLQALTSFLSGNVSLHPGTQREPLVEEQFDNAVLQIIKYVRGIDGQVFDGVLTLADRQARWIAAATEISHKLDGFGVVASLSPAALAAVTANQVKWVPRVQQQLAQVPTFDAINALQLAELAHKLRYTRPDVLLSETGLVVAGYGDADIFPSYRQIAVYGHVGDELCFTETTNYEITHVQPAMIQPLAQTSMIDMFTDGFGASLKSIIDRASRKALQEVIADLAAGGVVVPPLLGDQLVEQSHATFMTEWQRENWKQNYTPLIQVLATLDVQEMAHLAESLLGLESLKERVTSPTEEVGGPIDVAAITRAEGLVWVKRKHYFDAELNLRYAARVQRSLNP